MSKLVTSDNLKAYHAELAEHIKLLQRNTAYILDDIVNYDGLTLKCTTAGTTNTTKPNISALAVGSTYTDGTCVWTRVDLDKRGIDYWASSTTYVLNDQVVYNDKIYKCSIAHTSTSTFDDTKWTEISVSSSGGGLDYWATSTSYSVDDIVVYNNQIWRCTTAHTSSSTFDSTKFTEISASGAGGISVWSSNTQYAVNDVVIDSNLIWQCATAHTSTTTFDESKWICLSGGEISNGMEIVPLWEGSLRFNDNTPQQLNDNISNYDFLLFNIGVGSTRSNSITELIDVKDLSSIVYYRLFGGHPNYNFHAEIKFSGSTQFYIDDYIEQNGVDAYIYKVQGIRKAKPIVSSGMKYETLWEGEAGNFNGETTGIEISLSESITKYAKIGVYISTNDNSNNRYHYHEVESNRITDLIENGGSSDSICFQWGYGDSNDWTEIRKSSTSTELVFNVNKSLVKRIVGIGEGVQIPTGVQAARVTLWEGNYSTNNESENYNSFAYTQQLSDSLNNYDQIEITTLSNGGVSTDIFSKNDCINHKNLRCEIYATPQFYSVTSVMFKDEDTFGISWVNNVGFSVASVTKIVGIKYIQPDSYSTEEKLIGTWIDGKPLYRKVFTGLSITLQWNDKYFAFREDISLPLSNVDTLVSANGYGDNFSMPVTIDINRTTNLFSIRGVDIWTINSLVIEYTKN